LVKELEVSKTAHVSEIKRELFKGWGRGRNWNRNADPTLRGTKGSKSGKKRIAKKSARRMIPPRASRLGKVADINGGNRELAKKRRVRCLGSQRNQE